MWPKSKPEVEFQHGSMALNGLLCADVPLRIYTLTQHGSRLFPKAEAFVSQLWIEIEKLQIHV